MKGTVYEVLVKNDIVGVFAIKREAFSFYRKLKKKGYKGVQVITKKLIKNS